MFFKKIKWEPGSGAEGTSRLTRQKPRLAPARHRQGRRPPQTSGDSVGSQDTEPGCLLRAASLQHRLPGPACFGVRTQSSAPSQAVCRGSGAGSPKSAGSGFRLDGCTSRRGSLPSDLWAHNQRELPAAQVQRRLGAQGLLADAVCEPLYLSNAMFPKSVVLKWWGRAEEGDSCSGCTDNEIHRNQISPEHANNIPAGAPFSSRAGFLWLLQQFFFFNVIIFIIFA